MTSLCVKQQWTCMCLHLCVCAMCFCLCLNVEECQSQKCTFACTKAAQGVQVQSQSKRTSEGTIAISTSAGASTITRHNRGCRHTYTNTSTSPDTWHKINHRSKHNHRSTSQIQSRAAVQTPHKIRGKWPSTYTNIITIAIRPVQLSGSPSSPI